MKSISLYMLFSFMLCSINISYSQINSNIIIIIDSEIIVDNISSVRFILNEYDGSQKSFFVFYEPGIMTISNNEYKMITNKNVESIFLDFYYIDYLHNLDENRINYSIEFNTQWLFDRYAIIDIYNMGYNRRGVILSPLPGRKYTFEVRTPNPASSITRIK